MTTCGEYPAPRERRRLSGGQSRALPRGSLFDEVQECPNIISALKYFCQDFREIPVIATGSMVRIKLQRETHKRGMADNGKFLFPVEMINQITLYPMTFDEFLMNSNKVLYEIVEKTYESKTPLDTQIHELAMAHIINQSFQLKEHITMPLIPENGSSFRLFLGDIGMFSYQSGINAASFISGERESTLSGIFFENFAASELIAKGHKLFYWKGKASAELEFIVESDNRLYPIDVKKAGEH